MKQQKVSTQDPNTIASLSDYAIPMTTMPLGDIAKGVNSTSSADKISSSFSSLSGVLQGLEGTLGRLASSLTSFVSAIAFGIGGAAIATILHPKAIPNPTPSTPPYADMAVGYNPSGITDFNPTPRVMYMPSPKLPGPVGYLTNNIAPNYMTQSEFLGREALDVRGALNNWGMIASFPLSILGGPLGIAASLGVSQTGSILSELGNVGQARRMQNILALSVPRGESESVMGVGPDLLQAEKMARVVNEVGNANPFMSKNTVKSLLPAFTEMDLLDNIKSTEDFSSRFKKLIDTTRYVAGALHTSLNDAVKMMGDLKAQGIANPDVITNLAYIFKTSGEMSGIRPQRVMQTSEQIGQMYNQNLGISGGFMAGLAGNLIGGMGRTVQTNPSALASANALGGVSKALPKTAAALLSSRRFQLDTRAALLASVKLEGGKVVPDNDFIQKLENGKESYLQIMVKSESNEARGITPETAEAVLGGKLSPKDMQGVVWGGFQSDLSFLQNTNKAFSGLSQTERIKRVLENNYGLNGNRANILANTTSSAINGAANAATVQQAIDKYLSEKTFSWKRWWGGIKNWGVNTFIAPVNDFFTKMYQGISSYEYQRMTGMEHINPISSAEEKTIFSLFKYHPQAQQQQQGTIGTNKRIVPLAVNPYRNVQNEMESVSKSIQEELGYTGKNTEEWAQKSYKGNKFFTNGDIANLLAAMKASGIDLSNPKSLSYLQKLVEKMTETVTLLSKNSSLNPKAIGQSILSSLFSKNNLSPTTVNNTLNSDILNWREKEKQIKTSGTNLLHLTNPSNNTAITENNQSGSYTPPPTPLSKNQVFGRLENILGNMPNGPHSASNSKEPPYAPHNNPEINNNPNPRTVATNKLQQTLDNIKAQGSNNQIPPPDVFGNNRIGSVSYRQEINKNQLTNEGVASGMHYTMGYKGTSKLLVHANTLTANAYAGAVEILQGYGLSNKNAETVLQESGALAEIAPEETKKYLSKVIAEMTPGSKKKPTKEELQNAYVLSVGIKDEKTAQKIRDYVAKNPSVVSTGTANAMNKEYESAWAPSQGYVYTGQKTMMIPQVINGKTTYIKQNVNKDLYRIFNSNTANPSGSVSTAMSYIMAMNKMGVPLTSTNVSDYMDYLNHKKTQLQLPDVFQKPGILTGIQTYYDQITGEARRNPTTYKSLLSNYNNLRSKLEPERTNILTQLSRMPGLSGSPEANKILKITDNKVVAQAAKIMQAGAEALKMTNPPVSARDYASELMSLLGITAPEAMALIEGYTDKSPLSRAIKEFTQNDMNIGIDQARMAYFFMGNSGNAERQFLKDFQSQNNGANPNIIADVKKLSTSKLVDAHTQTLIKDYLALGEKNAHLTSTEKSELKKMGIAFPDKMKAPDIQNSLLQKIASNLITSVSAPTTIPTTLETSSKIQAEEIQILSGINSNFKGMSSDLDKISSQIQKTMAGVNKTLTLLNNTTKTLNRNLEKTQGNGSVTTTSSATP